VNAVKEECIIMLANIDKTNDLSNGIMVLIFGKDVHII